MERRVALSDEGYAASFTHVVKTTCLCVRAAILSYTSVAVEAPPVPCRSATVLPSNLTAESFEFDVAAEKCQWGQAKAHLCQPPDALACVFGTVYLTLTGNRGREKAQSGQDQECQ